MKPTIQETNAIEKPQRGKMSTINSAIRNFRERQAYVPIFLQQSIAYRGQSGRNSQRIDQEVDSG